MPKSPLFISLDIETTGFHPFKDEIIEVAAVKFDYKKIHAQFTQLVNPGIPITLMISRLTGIKNSDLKNAPKLDSILPQVKEFVEDYPIIGHNIQFDLNFLKAKGLDLPNFQLDTCDLARVLLPNLESYSLEILSKILKLPQITKHRALDDCLVARDLFLYLAQAIAEIPRPTLKTIQKVVGKSKWPLKDLFIVPPPKSRAKTTKTSQTTEKSAQPSLFQAAATTIHPEKSRTFTSNPTLRKALTTHLPKNEPALFECEQYAPEDYLKPAIDFAAKENTQILSISYESPPEKLQAEVAELNSPEHYLCQNQLEAFLNQDFFNPAEVTLLIKVLLNLKNSETGQKPDFTLFQDEHLAWMNISAHEFTCEKCAPEKCFYQKALQKIKNAPVVQVSPYFFFKHSAKNLPPVKTAILNQAQKLIDQKINLFTEIYSLERIQATLKRLTHKNPTPALENLDSRFEMLFGLIGIFLEKYKEDNNYQPQVNLDDHRQNTPEWQKVSQAAQNILQIQEEYLESLPGTSPLHHSLKPLLTLMQALTLGHNQIIWINSNHNQQILIKIIPQNLEELIQQKIREVTPAPIYIGQALSSQPNNFNFTKQALGLTEPGSPKIPVETIPTENKTKTPFHYITNLPEPLTDENFRATTKLLLKTIQKTKGLTFFLGQNQKALESFHLKLMPEIDPEKIALLTQNMSGGQGKIISHYLENPAKSFILGTIPLFHRLLENCPAKHLPTTLILHRLPFESMYHPYLKFKLKSLSDSFTTYTIPKAILKFKQVLLEFLSAVPKPKQIICVDSRLDTKQYGPQFLKGLPSGLKASSLKVSL